MDTGNIHITGLVRDWLHSLVPRFLCGGGGKKAWYTLFVHGPSFLGHLHTTPLHYMYSQILFTCWGCTACLHALWDTYGWFWSQKQYHSDGASQRLVWRSRYYKISKFPEILGELSMHNSVYQALFFSTHTQGPGDEATDCVVTPPPPFTHPLNISTERKWAPNSEMLNGVFSVYFIPSYVHM